MRPTFERCMKYCSREEGEGARASGVGEKRVGGARVLFCVSNKGTGKVVNILFITEIVKMIATPLPREHLDGRRSIN